MVTVTWILVMFIGTPRADFANIYEHTFHTRKACVETLASMKAQRPDKFYPSLFDKIYRWY